jgi:glycosyltransferase involved in cell wall biosynthesis
MNTQTQASIELLIPVFNEATVIEEHLRQIIDTAAAIEADCRLTLLVIDDGSTDGTPDALARFCLNEPRARWLGFTRNFGKEAAIQAGLENAEGDAVILLDSDLQHPPELILQMVQLWRGGAKVVEAYKADRRQESLSSRLFAVGFYRLFHSLADFDLHGQSDYKLLDWLVVVQYRQLQERGRFFRGLIQWMNYSTARIPFSVPERAGGSSKWNQIKLLRYALQNITAFSAKPLQFVTWCGLASLVVGVIFGGVTLFQKLQGHALGGFTTLILLQIFFSGAIMLSLGVIGHYLGRIHEEIKQRPIYLLRPEALSTKEIGNLP